VLALALAPRADEGSDKWLFAGENQGVSFYLKVKRECKETGSTVTVKLESQLDYPVTVSFRVNDPGWHKSLKKDLKSHGTDARTVISPEYGGACHPFVDEITVEPKEEKVSQKQSDDD
jgi:hypothetical protein